MVPRRDAADPHIVKGSAPEISEGAATDFIRAFPGGAKAKQKRADRKKADQDLLDHVAGDRPGAQGRGNKNRPSPVEGKPVVYHGRAAGEARCSGAALPRHDGTRRTATLRPC